MERRNRHRSLIQSVRDHDAQGVAEPEWHRKNIVLQKNVQEMRKGFKNVSGARVPYARMMIDIIIIRFL